MAEFLKVILSKTKDYMKKILTIFLTAALGTLSSLNGEIIEVGHFQEITSHLTPDTLILVDIDDTLLIPSQMLGCDEWFLYRWNKYQVEGMNFSRSLEKSLAEWEAVRHLTKMDLVEENCGVILQGLQKQGYHVMGLTSQGLALATRTSLQLQEHDIDFSISCPFSKGHYMELHGHGILYRNGILFTSGKPKGEALFKFCEGVGYQPKRIVFINDKATHLADIEDTAIEKGVEFIGLRYAYSDARKAAFRPEIAEFQFSHSTFDHILSDSEAVEMLDNKTQ